MTEGRKTLSIKTSTSTSSSRTTTVVKRKRRHHHKPGSTSANDAAQAASRDLSAKAELLKKARENGKKSSFQGQKFTPVFENKPKKVEPKKETKPVVTKSEAPVTKEKKHHVKKEFTNNKPAGFTAAPKKAKEATNEFKAKAGNGKMRGKINTSKASAMASDDYQGHRRSLASVRRAQEKWKRKQAEAAKPKEKVFRDVIIPETITVGELANRMTEKSGDVIKKLMGLGVMATINQAIDADTAQLLVEEMGHKVVRVAEADVEDGLAGEEDTNENLKPRCPVVTVMGHVDHGKTSLLDAIRKTDVVSRESGGITQHIGAYQVNLASGDKMTFIDTPGHETFSEMRARGANVTDIVILVVAANDSIMPQTIEAIAHAKAAEVPIIVAINKCDLPEANPMKVKQDLLQHEIVTEDFSGDTQAIEVSAITGKGIDTLEEAILLQAEMLELKANPDRTAVGAVVETRIDKGRGQIATVLIQKGTLKIGDIFVAGKEWGKVRAIINDRNEKINEATPSQPVEVLGLNGMPAAGDDFVVVENEAKAREVAEYRTRKYKESLNVVSKDSDSIFAKFKQDSTIKELPVIIKADVHGSVEAIAASLHKMTEDNDEVRVKVLLSGVGAINESDITLARASQALVVGFNVRANSPAREQAKRDNVDIRYYSVIYNIIDDAKAMLSGMLSPTIQENFIGYAKIGEVFNITGSGKIAGCQVTEGKIIKGAKVRLLRDNVVIHEGMLKTLKRFKDEVKEVKAGMECGMAFENYEDIKVGDQIEGFEVKSIERSL